MAAVPDEIDVDDRHLEGQRLDGQVGRDAGGRDEVLGQHGEQIGVGHHLAGGEAGMRAALPNSRIMVHQPSGGFQGQVTDILIHAKEVEGIKRCIEYGYMRREIATALGIPEAVITRRLRGSAYEELGLRRPSES